ncbi:MAG: UvrABC system protein A [Candidatus Moranbacteria bacterium GW2011_GWE2_35_2-]|nr:MAG: UvrABC system protein A [Candidatus Moranbacteria bacterium GW2011_GWE2_35_2-]KKQ22217.1 MAG: UvrABC system protein A [Candidatus Moranbacteria bacterium GW2011_GWF2_37_11]KKQ28727.1 MAG: UvrABC system protein A [Candidatus Moranbacteria bacterium GW2011_GWD1_37_17]KKQ30291.1 MAG: UvrABC system protein A [Candidatus Moranbacteria bacterium GW2011_GWE1_37_24]
MKYADKLKNMDKKIIIRGAREHNLKNINLDIPREKLIVFMGISGSGKSTLAFDTLFAEGQRRYLESLSSYARQFLGQMDKPDVDYIEGLSPTISIDQKSVSHNPRSTVGTITEIHDYLRLLYSKIGIPHCEICAREIKRLSTDEIVDRILDLGDKKIVEIISPIVRSRKGEYAALLENLWKMGLSKIYVDGKIFSLENRKKIKLEKNKRHSLEVVIDEVEISEKTISRIFEAVEKALKLSGGIVKINLPFSHDHEKMVNFKKRKNDTEINIENNEIIFNQNLSCPVHEIEFPPLEPRLFSFNSPFGACSACEGLGVKKEIDASLIVPDENKTINEGGILPWSYKPNNYQGTIIRAVTNFYHIPDNKRLRDLPKKYLDLLLYGKEGGELIDVKYHFRNGTRNFHLDWKGVSGWLEDRYQKTTSDAVRNDIEKYMSQKPCSTCGGSRYRKEVLLVTVGGKNIVEVSQISIDNCLDFFRKLELNHQEELIAGRIVNEVINRLKFLSDVGLNYISLHRTAFTLSGGESQRIRLASQVGSQLVGVLYILDEPSIGLHARDNRKLLETLKHLRDIGNTVIAIEHDEETMREADFLVDIGPGAGKHGGEIVALGTPEQVMKNQDSITGKYLSGKMQIKIPDSRRSMKNKKALIVRGASNHNLKNINVQFPLKSFVCVTGVSGSGKSTLVEETLHKALANKLHRSLEVPGKHKEIVGLENINKVIMIDQSPIGRTPRSNPATYTGLFTPIRQLFSATKDARLKGYGPGRFSFNVNGGRCDNCQGEGFLKIEMQFMPDVHLPCDICKGRRYNRETLQVKYKGKNISDVLAMTVSEAKEFFESYPQIHDPLKVLEEVGLGYIELGQNATTLSGGEAQRIKLASELSRRATGDTLYILDEPTTGLHFDDIKKLLNVLNRLVDAGNTVVVIEHNMDVIKSADWIIDLGPEGGDGGGKLVVAGTPEEVAKWHKESYTGKYLREALRKK